MPPRYHAQIRWLVVYKRCFLCERRRDVGTALLVSSLLMAPRTIVRRMACPLLRYERG